MGVDYYAQSIIGVKIANPRVKTIYRGCKHTAGKGKFCAECGQPTFVESTELHPVIEKLENGSEKMTKLGLIWGTDQEEAYVGFFKCETDSSRCGGARDSGKVALPDINIQELKKALQEELKELYNENNFGLWTILYCSY